MEKTISVFFGTDRTYIGIFNPTPEGIFLEHIDSSSQPLQFIMPDTPEFKTASDEVKGMLSEVKGMAQNLTVTFSVESALIHQIPNVGDASYEDLQELMSFEIRQQLPDYNLRDFHAMAYPLARQLNGTEMMLAVSIEKNFMNFANETLGVLGLKISNVEISQLAAHAALLYNYPEHAGGSVAVFGVQENYIDVSVLKQGSLAYYNLINLPSPEDVGFACNGEIKKLLADYVPYIDAAFLFGVGLNRDMLEQVRNVIKLPTERLNAFRMMKTSVGDRERQYCARVAHIFPPCVGGALPVLQEGIQVA